MKVLTINTGSSSLKYRLSDPSEQAVLASGLIERIGADSSAVKHESAGMTTSRELEIPDHRRAFEVMTDLLTGPESGVIGGIDEVDAVGHRVVHGGDRFYESAEITDEVQEAIREFQDLAPLHNPINLLGIEIAKELLPGIPHVAVFDTAFHQSMPETAYLYAIPYRMYRENRIRKYGFHGTSHWYVSRRAASLLDLPLERARMVTCHLGNGCSVAAVDGGRSIDTSMGFTPLEGLVMGTRSGDLDPSIVFFLVNKRGYRLAEVEDLLNRRSGILGISGISNDVKTVLEAAKGGDDRASLALEIFAYRVKKYIGAYLAILEGLDCLVFTAGIGERSPDLRRMICNDLGHLGIRLDPDLNRRCVGEEMVISPEGSGVKVVVVPTDEEEVIAQETHRIASEERE